MKLVVVDSNCELDSILDCEIGTGRGHRLDYRSEHATVYESPRLVIVGIGLERGNDPLGVYHLETQAEKLHGGAFAL
jgi:hypothetical protein